MTAWWQGAVIYQIYPRSFMDATGDGVGDIPGIVSRLPDVASLGVDGIWVSPVFASPMDDFGYDVSDYRAIDPMFGTNADGDMLIERCHAHGLKLIYDLVISHTSSAHAWFQQARLGRDNAYSDWYTFIDAKPDGSLPNNWLSVFGGPAWTYEPARDQYYLHNFLSSQPDLNYHNPAVREAMLDIFRFWLDKGVDGFRLDVANHYYQHPSYADNPAAPPGGDGVPLANPYAAQLHVYDKSQPENVEFLHRIRDTVDAFEGRMTVAEIFDADSVARAAEYVAPGRLHTAYSFSLIGGDCTADHVARALNHWRDESARHGGGWPSWALSNHDAVRAASRNAPGSPHRAAIARQMLGLLLCLPGTIFLYQGEELGLPEADVPFDRLQDPYGKEFWPDYKGRDGCRTPYPWTAGADHAGFSPVEPWLPVDPRHQALARDAQERDPQSCLWLTRRLIALRKATPALRTADFEVETHGGLLRLARPGAVAVTGWFNIADEPVQIETGGAMLAGDAAFDGARLVLPPRGWAWLQS